VLCCPPERLTMMGRAGADLVARNHDVANECRRLADLFRRSTSMAPALPSEPRQGARHA
jgi:hypothetical protein